MVRGVTPRLGHEVAPGPIGSPSHDAGASRDSRSWELSNRHAFGRRRVKEDGIPGNEDEIGIAHAVCGGEVDGVVAPKPMCLGEVACPPSKPIVELDEIELLEA